MNRQRARIIRSGGEGSATVSRGCVRSTSSRPRKELPRFFPELEPSYEVTLGYGAGKLIRSELRSGPRSVENGGWLFCHPHRTSELVLATDTGSDGFGRRGTIDLGEEPLEVVGRLAPHLTVCGDWHSHPGGDGLPTDVDRRAWQRGRELTRSHWIGLIVTVESAWSVPRYHGWITVANGNLPFCEPLRLREI